MSHQDFTTTILVGGKPQDVFDLLTDARNWWSGLYGEEIEGSSQQLGDEFTFRAGNGAHYSRQKLVESTPGERIAWEVTDSNLRFLKQPGEWTGTTLGFRLASRGADQTEVTFTHAGLSPDIECYNSCAPAWGQYMKRLEHKLKA